MTRESLGGGGDKAKSFDIITHKIQADITEKYKILYNHHSCKDQVVKLKVKQIVWTVGIQGPLVLALRVTHGAC
ncbi:hypothetical protein Hanom_Chr09g00759401 [Helianthus anomalus]